MRFTIVTSALALMTLTACGGGGGGGSGFVAPTGPAGLVALYDESQALSGRFAERAPAEFGVAGSPASSATFQGVMVVGKDAPGTTYVGDVNLTVQFTSDGDISGSASGFYVYDSSGATGTVGASVPGSVTMAATDLTGSTFDVSANGTVDGSAMNGTLAGQFGAVDFLGNGIDGGDTIDAFLANGTVSYDGSNWNAIVRACTDNILPSC